MLKEFCQQRVRDLEAEIERQPDPSKALILQLFRNVVRCYEPNARTTWMGGAVPFEVVPVFDLAPTGAELVMALLSLTGQANGCFDEGAIYLQSTDTCPFSRGVLGAIGLDIMPRPRLLLRTSHNCNGGDKLFQVARLKYGVPYLLVDVPNDDTPGVEEYVAAQFRDFFQEIARLFEMRLDEGRVAEAIDRSNRLREHWVAINQLRRHVPSPIDGKEAFVFCGMLNQLQGTEAAIRLAETFRQKIQDNIAQGTYPVPSERLRILWTHAQPFYDTPIFEWLRNDQQVSIVFHELSHVYWEPLDPSDPYRSFARKALRQPFRGALSRRIELDLELAEQYQIDGVIHFNHWGCRHLVGGIRVMKEHFAQQGIPFLDFEGDLGDPRNFTVSAVQDKIEGFLEMIEGNKRN